jgi:hypothetical protein
MFACVVEKGEKGEVGAGMGTKNGAGDFEHRASKGGSLLFRRKSHNF